MVVPMAKACPRNHRDTAEIPPPPFIGLDDWARSISLEDDKGRGRGVRTRGEDERGVRTRGEDEG